MDVRDTAGSDILGILPVALYFVKTALQGNGGVLIHWYVLLTGEAAIHWREEKWPSDNLCSVSWPRSHDTTVMLASLGAHLS